MTTKAARVMEEQSEEAALEGELWAEQLEFDDFGSNFDLVEKFSLQVLKTNPETG